MQIVKSSLFCIVFLCLVNWSFAGGWTLEKGRLWVKTSFFYQKTDERFASANIFCGSTPCYNGERTNYFFNGEAESFATFLDINYGLTERLELEVQLPYYSISFIDDADPDRPTTSEFGDVRFGLRYNFLTNPLVYTLEVQAKAPTGFFNKDAEIVPVGDGQWDLLINNQFSRSLWPWPAYVNLELGYRLRFDPDVEETNFAPGDEFNLRFDAGYNLLDNFSIKGSLSGLFGKEGSAILTDDEELTRINSDRRILYLEPGIYWEPIKNFAIDASVKFALSGKNFPAGEVFGIGVSYIFFGKD